MIPGKCKGFKCFRMEQKERHNYSDHKNSEAASQMEAEGSGSGVIVARVRLAFVLLQL